MIKSIAHAAYATSDMKATLDFYCNKLGLKHVFDLKDEKGNPWIEYVKVADGQFLEFFYAKAVDPAPNLYRHLCLEVEDCVAAGKEIESKGVTLFRQPKLGVDGNWQCWVKDPMGFEIEIMQIGPDSPQAKA